MFRTPPPRLPMIAFSAVLVAGVFAALPSLRGDLSEEGEDKTTEGAISSTISSQTVSSALSSAASSTLSSAASSAPSSAASSIPASAASSAASVTCNGADQHYSALAGDKDGFGIGQQLGGMYSTYGAFVPETGGPKGTDQGLMDRPLLGSNYTPAAAQHPYHTPHMIKAPNPPGFTIVTPPIPGLAFVPVQNIHRAWIEFGIADVDDAPAIECSGQDLNLQLRINGGEVGAFDNLLQKIPGQPDTFYNGTADVTEIPFDPALLYLRGDPGINTALITVDQFSPASSDALLSEVFAIDYVSIHVDVNCRTQWPACDDGRDNDPDTKFDFGNEVDPFYLDPGCTNPPDPDNDESNPYVDPCAGGGGSSSSPGSAGSTPNSSSGDSSGASSTAPQYCCMSDKGTPPFCRVVTPGSAHLCQYGIRYSDAMCGSVCPAASQSSSAGGSPGSGGSQSSASGGSSTGSDEPSNSSTGSVGSGSSGGSAQPGSSAPGTPATCGNARREGSEGCDDGNRMSGDGCSATCTVEQGWACVAPSPSGTGGSSDAGGGMTLFGGGSAKAEEGRSPATSTSSAPASSCIPTGDTLRVSNDGTMLSFWQSVNGGRLPLMMNVATGETRWIDAHVPEDPETNAPWNYGPGGVSADGKTLVFETAAGRDWRQTNFVYAYDWDSDAYTRLLAGDLRTPAVSRRDARFVTVQNLDPQLNELAVYDRVAGTSRRIAAPYSFGCPAVLNGDGTFLAYQNLGVDGATNAPPVLLNLTSGAEGVLPGNQLACWHPGTLISADGRTIAVPWDAAVYDAVRGTTTPILYDGRATLLLDMSDDGRRFLVSFVENAQLTILLWDRVTEEFTVLLQTDVAGLPVNTQGSATLPGALTLDGTAAAIVDTRISQLRIYGNDGSLQSTKTLNCAQP